MTSWRSGGRFWRVSASSDGRTSCASASAQHSAVSTELFDEQGAAYRADILPDDALIVSIEAGTTFGWERYTGRHGLRFGIDSFGASAPIEDLFKHFGLTADAIAPQILERLNA